MSRRTIPALSAAQLQEMLVANGQPHPEPFPERVRAALQDRVAQLCAREGVSAPTLVRAADDHSVFLVGWGEHAVIGVGTAVTNYSGRLLDAALTHELRHHAHQHNYDVFRAAARVERLRRAAVRVAESSDMLWLRGRWAARRPGAAASLSAAGYRARAAVTTAGAMAIGVGTVATSLTEQARSRRRELTADREAARSSGDPVAMAAAIERFHAERPAVQPTTLVERVTSTHPTVAARLRSLARAERGRGDRSLD